MSHWSAIKEKSTGYWQIKSMLFIYKLLGERIFKLCLYPIVLVFFLVSSDTRKISREYLSRVHKIKNQNIPVTNKIIFKHIFSFADSLADKVIAWSGNLSVSGVNVKTDDTYKKIADDLKNNRGVFLICSHLGNVEALRAIGNIEGDAVYRQEMRMNTILQTGHSEHYNRMLKQLHPDVSNNIISASDIGADTMLMLKDKIGAGEMVIAAGDRTAATNQQRSISLPFLGDEALFPEGTFVMASLMECPVYFVFLLKNPSEKMKYDFYIYDSGFDFAKSRKERKKQIENMMVKYRDCLENLTLEYPYQWYNFFDFWKV